MHLSNETRTTDSYKQVVDLGGGCREYGPPPPTAEMKPSSTYSPLQSMQEVQFESVLTAVIIQLENTLYWLQKCFNGLLLV